MSPVSLRYCPSAHVPESTGVCDHVYRVPLYTLLCELSAPSAVDWRLLSGTSGAGIVPYFRPWTAALGIRRVPAAPLDTVMSKCVCWRDRTDH